MKSVTSIMPPIIGKSGTLSITTNKNVKTWEVTQNNCAKYVELF